MLEIRNVTALALATALSVAGSEADDRCPVSSLESRSVVLNRDIVVCCAWLGFEVV